MKNVFIAWSTLENCDLYTVQYTQYIKHLRYTLSYFCIIDFIPTSCHLWSTSLYLFLYDLNSAEAIAHKLFLFMMITASGYEQSGVKLGVLGYWVIRLCWKRDQCPRFTLGVRASGLGSPEKKRDGDEPNQPSTSDQVLSAIRIDSNWADGRWMTISNLLRHSTSSLYKDYSPYTIVSPSQLHPSKHCPSSTEIFSEISSPADPKVEDNLLQLTSANCKRYIFAANFAGLSCKRTFWKEFNRAPAY